MINNAENRRSAPGDHARQDFAADVVRSLRGAFEGRRMAAKSALGL